MRTFQPVPIDVIERAMHALRQTMDCQEAPISLRYDAAGAHGALEFHFEEAKKLAQKEPA